MNPITDGIYVPSRVATRILEGKPTVIISAVEKAYAPGDFLLASPEGVLGVATLGEMRTSSPSEFINGKEPSHLSKGVVRGLVAKCPVAYSWGVSFQPFVEPVPLAVKGELGYGDLFGVGVALQVDPIDPVAVGVVRKVKTLAASWADSLAPWLEEGLGEVGPETSLFAAALPAMAEQLVSALAPIPIRPTTKAAGGDFQALTDALDSALREMEVAAPDLWEGIKGSAGFTRSLQGALPLMKRSYAALKLPDPLWAVQRLLSGKRAGFLSAKPRAARVGADQLLVNEVGMKPGTAEQYGKPFAWAVVRTGQPEAVERGQIPRLPLDQFSRAEWAERKDPDVYFIPLQLVHALDPPVELREAPPGRRFASAVDLDAAAMEKADLPDPVVLRQLNDNVLWAIQGELSERYQQQYEGNKETRGREDLVNAYAFLVREFARRNLEPAGILPGLKAEMDALDLTKRDTAPILSGSKGGQSPITLPQVLEHMSKPIVLRRGVVTVVGSVCNQGATTNDVDILLQGPLDEGTRRVIEFRLGRSFPAHISNRISFLHDPDLGGPFTDHVQAFDLVLVPREEKAVVEMRLIEKADDPLLDMPPKRGPRSAVFQFHWRGKSLHGDLRFKVGSDYLVGWTMMLQKPDIPGPTDLREAKAMARTFEPDGGKYNKDFLAPEGIQATPKSRQPVGWLHVQGQFIEPGEVGATRNLPGLIVEVPDSPEFMELGMQKPWYHEYFLTGGKKMAGRLMCRLLTGSRQKETDLPYWRCMLSREFLPSVLGRRAVTTKAMPPNGFSWIPVSLEKQTPPEYRYWEKKGEDARKVRDALVKDRFFTGDNVRLVNGQFARVEETRKYTLFLPDGVEPADILKQPKQAKFVLAHQLWKGQRVVRGGPTREQWRFALDLGGKLRQWVLQTNPLAGQTVSAIERPLKGRALWDLKGDVEPGKSYDGDVFNETKATPSAIDRLDAGSATVLEEKPGFLKLRLRGDKLRGTFALVAEEPGANIWAWERSEGPGDVGKYNPAMQGDVQVWDPKRIPHDADRTNDRRKLRPPALFKPQKVPARPTNEFNTMEEVKAFATPERLKQGIVVEPKWNGFRLVAEAWGDGSLIFTEDEQRDLSAVLPGLAAELRALPTPFILDAEGMAVDAEGNPVPRRDLAQFRGKEPADDEGFRLKVFGALYLPDDGNLTALAYTEQKSKLSTFLRRAKGKRIELTPSKVVHSWGELRKVVEWASKEAGSEGAMLKLAGSSYSLGGENSSWAKYKRQRTLQAIVYNRDSVKGSPGVFNLECAVGPVNPEHWKETVEVGGKHYTVIGRTANAKTEANRGDTVVVDVLELLYERLSGGKQRVHWFGPPTLSTPFPVRGKPFTVDQVLSLLEPGEVKKHVDSLIERAVHLVSKADGPSDECFVFGEVLVPNIGTGEKKDSQGDTYTEKDVSEACYSFMRRGHHIGLMHKTFIDGKVVLLENYLMPADVTLKDMAGKDRKIPKGTWMMKLQVKDPALKKAVRSGKLTGFSVGGSGTRTRVT